MNEWDCCKYTKSHEKSPSEHSVLGFTELREKWNHEDKEWSRAL